MGFLAKEKRPKYALKFLTYGQMSNLGYLHWEKGVWNSVSGRLVACQNGLHLVREGIVRWCDWAPEMWIAEIDTSKSVLVNDLDYPHQSKLVVRRARIIKRIKPTKTALARFVDSHGGWRSGDGNNWVTNYYTRRRFLRTSTFTFGSLISYTRQFMREPKRITELADWLIREYAPELFADES